MKKILKYFFSILLFGIIGLSFIQFHYIFDYIEYQGEVFRYYKDNIPFSWQFWGMLLWYGFLRIHYGLALVGTLIAFKASGFVYKKHITESKNLV